MPTAGLTQRPLEQNVRNDIPLCGLVCAGSCRGTLLLLLLLLVFVFLNRKTQSVTEAQARGATYALWDYPGSVASPFIFAYMNSEFDSRYRSDAQATCSPMACSTLHLDAVFAPALVDERSAPGHQGLAHA